MSTNATPGNPSYKDLVESDKRSILEKVLEATFPTPKSKDDTPATSNAKNATPGSTLGISDYDLIFGEDINDIDELWEDIMKRAKEEFKKQEELKKKYPDIDPLKDIFKKPAPKKTRKRGKITSKVIDNTVSLMNNFKKRLIESSEQVPANKPMAISSNNNYDPLKSSVISSSNNNYKQLETLIIPSPRKDYHQFKSSIKTIMQGVQSQEPKYPVWKTTENYTPVFSVRTNPNFANPCSDSTGTNFKQLCTPDQKKFYTPGHISSWMDTATNSNLTEPPSCKSIRSDVAVHDSDSDEDSDSMKSIGNTSIYFSPEYKTNTDKNSNVNYKTPLKNTTNSSIRVNKNTMSSNIPTLKNTISSNVPTIKNTNSSSAIKSTTVRFRPSPPEYFVYGNNDNSSIASDQFSIEQNENNTQQESPGNYNEFYDQDGNENSVPLQHSPLSLETQYSPSKENIEYEEHHHIFSSKSLHDNIQKKISNRSMMKPDKFIDENFVRNLNNSVINNFNNINYSHSNNYNMELQYSMKVKYYK